MWCAMCLMSPIFAAGTLQAENGMILVTASNNSAVLRCSLSGYRPLMAVPSITWRLSNNELLSNDSVNTITSEPPCVSYIRTWNF